MRLGRRRRRGGRSRRRRPGAGGAPDPPDEEVGACGGAPACRGRGLDGLAHRAYGVRGDLGRRSRLERVLARTEDAAALGPLAVGDQRTRPSRRPKRPAPRCRCRSPAPSRARHPGSWRAGRESRPARRPGGSPQAADGATGARAQTVSRGFIGWLRWSRSRWSSARPARPASPPSWWPRGPTGSPPR